MLQTSGWEPPAPPEHPRCMHEPQADKQPHVQEKCWQGNLASPAALKGTGWGAGVCQVKSDWFTLHPPAVHTERLNLNY